MNDSKNVQNNIWQNNISKRGLPEIRNGHFGFIDSEILALFSAIITPNKFRSRTYINGHDWTDETNIISCCLLLFSIKRTFLVKSTNFNTHVEWFN